MPIPRVLLVAGYLLAVPFTLWVPGFLRLWRRREPAVFAVAELGAALLVAGYALSGSAVGIAVNGAWLVGLAGAYTLEGRARRRAEHSVSHLVPAPAAPRRGRSRRPRAGHRRRRP